MAMSGRSGTSRELALQLAAEKGSDIGGDSLRLALTHGWLDHAVGSPYTTKEQENKDAVRAWFDKLSRTELERVRLMGILCWGGAERGGAARAARRRAARVFSGGGR